MICVFAEKGLEMDIADYKVIAVKYPHGEYRLGSPAEIIDEGLFYRVDGTHIFDKFKIISTEINGNELTIVMKDKTVLLEFEEKR